MAWRGTGRIYHGHPRYPRIGRHEPACEAGDFLFRGKATAVYKKPAPSLPISAQRIQHQLLAASSPLSYCPPSFPLPSTVCAAALAQVKYPNIPPTSPTTSISLSEPPTIPASVWTSSKSKDHVSVT